jgi:hypothetical protein
MARYLYTTGRDAVGGIFDVVNRNGPTTPGPGEFYPDENHHGGNEKQRLGPLKGPHFGKAPPKARAAPAVDLDGPSPGDYEPDDAPPPPRGQLPGPTISKTKRRSTLVAADAGSAPAPNEYFNDILYHPKSIAGAAREARKQPGTMKPPTAPRREGASAGGGAVYRPPPPEPGRGQYDSEEDPNLAPHKVGLGYTTGTTDGPVCPTYSTSS